MPLKNTQYPHTYSLFVRKKSKILIPKASCKTFFFLDIVFRSKSQHVLSYEVTSDNVDSKHLLKQNGISFWSALFARIC